MNCSNSSKENGVSTTTAQRMMGCSGSRPVPKHNFSDSEGNSMSLADYEEEELPGVTQHRGVHWDDDDDDDDDDDLMTEYNMDGSSNYRTRAMSSKGPRSAGGRSMMTLTTLDSEFLETMIQNDIDDLDQSEPGIFAPSLSLWHNDEDSGDILTQDVYVPSIGLTKYTYYCCLQWNAGMNGGGYCGIQDHPKGRNYIFSLWDPIGTNEKIQPVFVGPGTLCEPFGGEGTGLKTWNFSVGWEPDFWYTLVTRRWDQDDHTFFGFWVKHHLSMEWTHMVTLDFPVGDVYYDTLSCSFLEDWEGSGDRERRVHYKNGFKRGLNGKWLPFSKAVFSKVSEPRCKLFEEKFNAGVLDDTFYLHSGGESMPTNDVVNGCTFTRKMPEKPNVLPICVYLAKVTKEEVEWEIPAGSVPQFQYIVYVDRSIFKQEINSEMRKCKFDNPPREMVELLIEDIYGHAVRSKFKVDNPPSCDPETRTRLEVYIPNPEQLSM